MVSGARAALVVKHKATHHLGPNLQIRTILNWVPNEDSTHTLRILKPLRNGLMAMKHRRQQGRLRPPPKHGLSKIPQAPNCFPVEQLRSRAHPPSTARGRTPAGSCRAAGPSPCGTVPPMCPPIPVSSPRKGPPLRAAAAGASPWPSQNPHPAASPPRPRAAHGPSPPPSAAGAPPRSPAVCAAAPVKRCVGDSAVLAGRAGGFYSPGRSWVGKGRVDRVKGCLSPIPSPPSPFRDPARRKDWSTEVRWPPPLPSRGPTLGC